MNKSNFGNYFVIFLLLILSSCDFFQNFEKKVEKINYFEVRSFELVKKNKILKKKISDLEYEVHKLESKNNFLKLKLARLAPIYKSPSGNNTVVKGDNIIGKSKSHGFVDYVEFGLYKWPPEKLRSMGVKYLKNRDYKKSAEFFYTLIEKYADHPLIDDEVLYLLGITSYKSEVHLNWSKKYLELLISKYPRSQYLRKAKLWSALTYLKLDENYKFIEIVKEFGRKYRNTSEWKIISKHYYQSMNNKKK